MKQILNWVCLTVFVMFWTGLSSLSHAANPPSVTTLAASRVLPAGSVSLGFQVTSPTTGCTITGYEIRSRTSVINTLNYATSTVSATGTATAGALVNRNLSGLTGGTKYWFAMKVSQSCAGVTTWSALSNVVSATPFTATPIVGLAWNASQTANVSGYRVHFGTASGTYGSHVDCGNTTTCDVTVTAGPTYYFAVTAYFAAPGASGYTTGALESVYSNEAHWP